MVWRGDVGVLKVGGFSSFVAFRLSGACASLAFVGGDGRRGHLPQRIRPSVSETYQLHLLEVRHLMEQRKLQVGH